MIPYLCSSPAAIIVWPAGSLDSARRKTASGLCMQDQKLTQIVDARTAETGSFLDLARWVRASAQTTVGTTENEMRTTRDFFVFGKVRTGDLMEAYGLLYRMRWVRYRNGTPKYELTLAQNDLDKVYAPQNDFQRQRFEYTKSFIRQLDQLDPSARARVLSGESMSYADLPPTMKNAFKGAIGALIEGNAADRAKAGSTDKWPKQDINTLSEARIRIQEDSKPGTGIRELWLKVGSNLGGFNFRWNDYDPAKNYTLSPRPVVFIQEPVSNADYATKRMIARSPKMTELVTIPRADRTLAALLRYLATNYGVNFIANEDTARSTLPFTCAGVPLREVMDRIAREYGDWEWETGPGNFIVLRSQESPQRRAPSKKKE